VRARWLIAGGLGAIGLVWIGQGLGVLRGSSFMVDDARWAAFGAALLVAAVVVGLTALRSGPQP
jgi:hypothetical protein